MRKFKRVVIILAIVLLICALSAGLYFLLDYFNITSVSTLRKFISNFGAWGWLVFLIVEVVISTPLFVIPLEDELWVTLAILLFGAKLGCILSVSAMLISSALLYLFGRTCGFNLIKKFVGEKTLIDVQQKFSVKSKLSLPFLYLIPFFPHDVLCIVAGSSKMSFWYFIIITALMRSIEIISICFLGGGLIKWGELTCFDWLVLANLLIIDIYLLTKLQKYMEKRLENKSDKNKPS